MNRFLRLALLPGLIALMLAVGYWNLRPETFFVEETPRSELEPEIDFYAENARITQYQPNGSQKYQLDSPRMEHVRSTGNSRVEQPFLVLQRQDGWPWQIQSQRAEVSDQASQVELIDDVRVARTDGRRRSTVLTTSRLTVFPEREYAETSRPVRIDSPSGVTTATGLQADLKAGRMILQSSVRGQHEVR